MASPVGVEPSARSSVHRRPPAARGPAGERAADEQAGSRQAGGRCDSRLVDNCVQRLRAKIEESAALALPLAVVLALLAADNMLRPSTELRSTGSCAWWKT